MRANRSNIPTFAQTAGRPAPPPAHLSPAFPPAHLSPDFPPAHLSPDPSAPPAFPTAFHISPTFPAAHVYPVSQKQNFLQH